MRAGRRPKWWGQIDLTELPTTDPAIAQMFMPVQCAHCYRVYDAGKVEIIARYVDCSVWKAPCCGTTVDDRGETGWKLRKDYYRLDAMGRRV